MFNELDMIVLNRNIKENHLKKGDMGTIVHCYKKHQAYEVEFLTADGDTLAVLTLTESDIRPVQHQEILHVRELHLVAQ